MSEYLRLEPEKTNLLLNEYLAFGGYPRVVLAATSAEKQMEMAEIYQSYLEKDIAYFLQLKKTESLSELKKPSVPRGLRGFILRYKPARAFLVNRSLRDTIEIDGTKLVFLPFYEWPEELTALVHSR